ncbi:DNA cytosine methyltransferase [Ensifer soli]|uniref:DNA cytosine methyltransferase n=1 Tax=Ciceribacter sp. sgz301302 TaxID=3342379 RepID=UPI0035BB1995
MALHSPSSDLRGIALCAGVGGLELGLHIAEPGYRTVCFVEREVFPAVTLVARMEDKALDHAPVWDDVTTFDGRPWRGKVHLLTGGYPCQPFSFSGLRRGEDDPRHLWPHIRRIIRELDPEWCFFENVEGHLSLGAASVIADLRGMGFAVKAGLFSALETGASHIRRRLFIVAHADEITGRQSGRPDAVRQGMEGQLRPRQGREPSGTWTGCADLDVELSADDRVRSATDGGLQLPLYPPSPHQFDCWAEILARRPDLQPELFGLDDGMADRMDRCEAAGNGVVSLVAAYAWRTLKNALMTC